VKLFRRRTSLEVPPEIAREIEAEIQDYLDRRIADLIEEGYGAAEARRRALADFGDLDEARRELGVIDGRIAARHGHGLRRRTGTARGGGVSVLRDDCRMAAKRLRRRPGSVLVAVAMLALAVGLSTAMVTVVDALLLRTVPFHEPESLVVIELPSVDGPSSGVNVPLSIVDALQASDAFDAVHGALSVAGVFEGGNEPMRYSTVVVTAGTLGMLGARPLLGRTFVAGEGGAGSQETVIVSERVWREQFASDPSILGRVIEVSGRPARVVGVMPADFRFPTPYVDVWLAMDAGNPRPWQRDMIGLWVYARLRPGVPLDDALQRATEIAQATDPWAATRRATARSLARSVDDYSARALVAIAAGVALVFLVLCANSANVLLVRLASRRREFATASALGASRLRLLRQALIEHALMGLAAVGAGVAIGTGALALVRAFVTDGFRLVSLNVIDLDGRALLATSLAGLFATILAGLLPAWLATTPSAGGCLRALVDRSGSESRAARLFSRALLTAEIAFAVALLVGAGILLRSFVNLTRMDLGIDPARVVTLDVSFPDHVKDFQEPAAVETLIAEVLEELDALPGIGAVALSSGAPPRFSFGYYGEVSPQGRQEAVTFERITTYRATRGFFEVFGITIVQGRGFETGDGRGAVVLGERLARILWPEGDAVGRTFELDRQTTFQVVGVAREIRTWDTADPRDDALEMYQFFQPDGRFLSALSATVSLRCAATCPPADLVRDSVHAVNARLLVDDVQRVSDGYAEQLARPRTAATLAVAFAVVTLLTFAGGLFSVLRYSVARRLPELGIRAALGASAASLGGAVVREGLTVAVAGLFAGGLAAAWLARLLTVITYDAPRPGVGLWLLVAGVVMLVTLGGSLPAARRAMNADPVSMLREQ
jgi:predicted permease